MHYICNVFGMWGHIRMRIMPNEGNDVIHSSRSSDRIFHQKRFFD